MEARTHYNRDYRFYGQSDLDLFLKLNNTTSMNGAVTNKVGRLLPKGRVPHVCVVGAGFAGLRTADILSQRGLKVTIIEARDRIGGRVSWLCVVRGAELRS